MSVETTAPLNASELVSALDTLKKLQYLPSHQRLQLTMALFQELLPNAANDVLCGIAAACIQALAKRATQPAVE